MKSKPQVSKRPLVFLGVGVFNVAVDFSFYTFLTATTFKNGHHIAVAGFISGSLALFCAFLTHGFITWRGTNITHRTVAKFVVLTGFGNWIVRPILLSLFIKLHGFYHWTQRLIHHVGLKFSYNFIANSGAFAFMLLIVLCYNYYVYSRYVFKDKPGLAELETLA